MRSKAVFVILLILFAGFVASAFLRSRNPAPAPPAIATPNTGDPEASSNARPIASAPASSSAAPGASSSGTQKDRKLLDRTLRVAAVGWDLIAPGVLANDGLAAGPGSTFGKAGIDVELVVLDQMKQVEEALARGGGDAKGADLAVVPMPAYVAAYERLRALDPRVFFVVGWSRGREAIYGRKAELVSVPAGEVTLLGAPGSSPAFVGLLTLELAGVSLSRVKLEEKADDKKPAMFEAIDLMAVAKPEPSRGKLQLTTADATGMVPVVAIAQAGFVDAHVPALSAWAGVWLQGEERIRADAAASARSIAKHPGAPEPLVLINRLGPLAWANLADNARWAGLSGRGAVTIETLFQRSWHVWKAAGLLSTPLPETPATAPAVITSLVRQLGPDTGPKKSAKSAEGAHGEDGVLLRYTAEGAKLDEAALVAEIGFLAGLFERSTIRVAVRGTPGAHKAKTAKLIESAMGRFGIEPDRLVAADKPAQKGQAVVDVLAAR